MALLVGHGFEEERVLSLTLPCFDALVQRVLRVRREELEETARTMFLATQCSLKDLDNWLDGLTGRKAEKKQEKVATGDDLLAAMGRNLGRVNRG